MIETSVARIIAIVKDTNFQLDLDELKETETKTKQYVHIQYYKSIQSLLYGEPPVALPNGDTLAMLYMGEEDLTGTNVYDEMAGQIGGTWMHIE